MSFATAERIAATRSQEGFYADAPALEAYHGKRRSPRHKSPIVARMLGSCDWISHTFAPRVGFKALDVTGDGERGFAELMAELAARPRSYTPDVAQDVTAVREGRRQNQAVDALLALELGEAREENKFPHSALISFSQDEVVELERILNAGAPDWVRELRRQLDR